MPSTAERVGDGASEDCRSEIGDTVSLDFPLSPLDCGARACDDVIPTVPSTVVSDRTVGAKALLVINDPDELFPGTNVIRPPLYDTLEEELARDPGRFEEDGWGEDSCSLGKGMKGDEEAGPATTAPIGDGGDAGCIGAIGTEDGGDPGGDCDSSAIC